MVVRATISFKLIFLKNEKNFVEKEPVDLCQMCQINFTKLI